MKDGSELTLDEYRHGVSLPCAYGYGEFDALIDRKPEGKADICRDCRGDGTGRRGSQRSIARAECTRVSEAPGETRIGDLKVTP